MKRPWDILFATILALLVLLGTFWGLTEYVRIYRRPAQNWLPQGSFRPDLHGQPQGWHTTGLACLRFERTSGHLPLNYLHLEMGSEAAWTELPLGQGWRLIHLSAWFRRAKPGPQPAGAILGFFMRGEQVLGRQRLEFGDADDDDWHQREAIWIRPPESTTLRLVLSATGPEPLDVAEIVTVPSYLYSEMRKVPTH
ncbi:MAG: hypothetical protein AMXMBFR33_42890 [Candidatus Xenobia bacterium]